MQNRELISKLLVTDSPAWKQHGILPTEIEKAVERAYKMMDAINGSLIPFGVELIKLLPMNSVSAILHDLLVTAIIDSAPNKFEQGRAYKYQDLRSLLADVPNLELKIALENNQPKGHLPKPGHYLTFRYVMGNYDGTFTRGKKHRGTTVWIYEIRFGYLDQDDFSFSDTVKDSGKTAPIKKESLAKMDLLYFDPDKCPVKLNKTIGKTKKTVKTRTTPTSRAIRSKPAITYSEALPT